MAKLRKDAATPAQRRRIRKLYEAGKTLREIERATGFSRSGIATYLHADGAIIRPRGRRQKRQPKSGGT
jgi:transposase